MFALILAIAIVVGDQSAAGACSCASLSVAMSTIVGTVEQTDGDAITFANVSTLGGPQMSDRVVVQIHGRRSSDPSERRTTTSCDVAFVQPVVGGVYQLTVNPVRPTVSACGGSVHTVTAPPSTIASPTPVDADDDSSLPLLPIAGVAIVAAAAGILVARSRAN